LAAKKGHVKIVKRLLEHPKMNWSALKWSDLSNAMGTEPKEIFIRRRQEYAKKRRASRTIIRYLYKRFRNTENMRDHIWKPGGYLSRTLAARYGNLASGKKSNPF
jgi:hypothetical protein